MTLDPYMKENFDVLRKDSVGERTENDCDCYTHTKGSRRRKLKSQGGYYLAILSNGKTIGTRNKFNTFSE